MIMEAISISWVKISYIAHGILHMQYLLYDTHERSKKVPLSFSLKRQTNAIKKIMDQNIYI